MCRPLTKGQAQQRQRLLTLHQADSTISILQM